jgi:NADPH-dependent 2,4-dienoyl-CoA reductase/sulfur reductase-like enzyme
VASQQHPVLGRRIRVEHWDTAIEQGKVAAHNLAGASEEYTHLPYFFTDQYDLGMEYFGSVGPDGYDRVDIEGDTDVVNGGAFRAYWVKDGTVRAAMHANDWDSSDDVRDSVGTTR